MMLLLTFEAIFHAQCVHWYIIDPSPLNMGMLYPISIQLYRARHNYDNTHFIIVRSR